MKTSFVLIALIAQIFAINFASANEPAEHTPILYPPKQANKTLSTPPGAVTLAEPKFFAAVSGGSVTLKWSAVETATQYHVQVATDPNFKWLVKEDHAVKATELAVSGLEAGNHYYWRVAAVKADNDPSFMKGPFAKAMFETK